MRLRRAGIITKLVIAALVIYAAVSLTAIKSKTASLLSENERLASEVEDLSQTNAGYQYEIEHSSDPKTLEDIARSKLGLVMPGEKIFYDISK